MFKTKVNGLFNSFLPTLIIFILNVMLYRALKLSRSRSKLVRIPSQVNGSKVKSIENRRTAKTQLILAFFFLLVSVPRSVSIAVFIFYRTDLSYVMFKMFALLSVVYFNSTLIILLVQNSAFKKQFDSLLVKRRRPILIYRV